VGIIAVCLITFRSVFEKFLEKIQHFLAPSTSEVEEIQPAVLVPPVAEVPVQRAGSSGSEAVSCEGDEPRVEKNMV